MLSFLELIANTLAQFGLLVAWGCTEVMNLVLSAVSALVSAVNFVELPAVPSPPSMIQGINWFFPIGSIVSIASSLATSFGAFLAVRWLFKKTGTL